MSPDLYRVFVWVVVGGFGQGNLFGRPAILSICSVAVHWQGTRIKDSADPSWSCIVKSTKVQGKREEDLVKQCGSIVCLLSVFWHLQQNID